MSDLIACISAFFSAFSRRRDLALENLALRQQLAIFKRRHPRPSLRPTDRLFWVWLSKIWTGLNFIFHTNLTANIQKIIPEVNA